MKIPLGKENSSRTVTGRLKKTSAGNAGQTSHFRPEYLGTLQTARARAGGADDRPLRGHREDTNRSSHTHRQHTGPDIFGQRQMPMPLHCLHKRRRQDMQALAAHSIRNLRKDNLSNLGHVAVRDITRPPFTRFHRSRTAKQTDRVLGVMSRHRHKFVQDPRLVRALRLTVALARDLELFVSCCHTWIPHAPAQKIGLGNILDKAIDRSKVLREA